MAITIFPGTCCFIHDIFALSHILTPEFKAFCLNGNLYLAFINMPSVNFPFFFKHIRPLPIHNPSIVTDLLVFCQFSKYLYVIFHASHFCAIKVLISLKGLFVIHFSPLFISFPVCIFKTVYTKLR